MKRIYRLFSILLLSSAAFFVSCDPVRVDPGNGQEDPKPDPEPEPTPTVVKPSEEIQQADLFASDALSVYYLWIKEIQNDLKRLDPDTCKTPIPVVQQIRYHQKGKEVDHWTQLTDDLNSMTSSAEGLGLTYGYDLQAGRISNKNGVYFLLVTYVVKDGPAEKAGMKRGDIIMTIDGKEITMNNIYDAFNTASVKLGIAHLTEDGYLGNVEKQVELAAVDMWEDPILLSKVFPLKGKKVGYLVYNSFDVKSMETLPDVFREFKEEGVTELILDLRYNGGGFVKTECERASLIAPMASVQAKDIFQTEVYNELLTEAWPDANTYFDKEFSYKDGDGKYDISVNILDAKPEISKLYVIVTGGSASASEGLIVGLGPYMDITLIGEQTYGKYCAGYMMPPDELYGPKSKVDYSKIKNWGIYVMFSMFADKNGKNASIPNGIPVDIEAEDDPFDGYQLGDDKETMLRAALTAAGKTYFTRSSSSGKPFPTEFIEHGMPRGMLIKTDIPKPIYKD